jgi:hypothetical protein
MSWGRTLRFFQGSCCLVNARDTVTTKARIRITRKDLLIIVKIFLEFRQNSGPGF